MNSAAKTSKLLAGREDTVQRIADAIEAANSIAIAAHEHPDGDAIGSTLALYHALNEQGKQAVVYLPNTPPDFFMFLPGFDDIANTKPDFAAYDLLVVLDSTKAARAHLEQEISEHPNTIVVDHHHGNGEEGDVNLVIPDAAATAHILYDLFRDIELPITKDVATCLLTGIFTDTGSFMHDSVTPHLLHIASDLMNKGARLSHIAHETFQKKDLPGLRIWGRALSRIVTSDATGASVSIITKDDLEDCNATLDDLTGVVNMLNTLPETKFAMLLVEHEDGKIKGSLRSEPHKGVDVSEIAQRLGGGGHKLAAGFEVNGHIVKQDDMWRIQPVEQVQSAEK